MRRKMTGLMAALAIGYCFSMTDVQAAKEVAETRTVAVTEDVTKVTTKKTEAAPVQKKSAAKKAAVKKTSEKQMPEKKAAAKNRTVKMPTAERKTEKKTAARTATPKKADPLAKYKTADGKSGYRVELTGIDGKTYLFDAKGHVYRRVGRQKIADAEYYFNKDHSLHIGWRDFSGGKRYYDNYGRLQKNTVVNYFDPKSTETSLRLINSRGYWVRKPGWKSMRAGKKKALFMVKKDGSLHTGPFYSKIYGNRLYDDYGIMVRNGCVPVTVKQKNGRSVTVPFFAENRKLITGPRWYTYKSDAYKKDKFYLDKKGKPCIGTRKIGKKTYRFSDGTNGNTSFAGAMITDWMWKFNGQWGSLNADGQPVRHKGFHKVVEYVYRTGSFVRKIYVDKDGSLHKGWLNHGKDRYFFDYQGMAVTNGIHTDNKKWYLFDQEGRLQRYRGLKKINGGTYCFNKDHSLRVNVDYRHDNGKKESRINPMFWRGFGPELSQFRHPYGLCRGLVMNLKTNKLQAFDLDGNRMKLVGRHTVYGYELNFDKNHEAEGGWVKYRGRKALLVRERAFNSDYMSYQPVIVPYRGIAEYLYDEHGAIVPGNGWVTKDIDGYRYRLRMNRKSQVLMFYEVITIETLLRRQIL